jgi:hypothetical protein
MLRRWKAYPSLKTAGIDIMGASMSPNSMGLHSLIILRQIILRQIVGQNWSGTYTAIYNVYCALRQH